MTNHRLGGVIAAVPTPVDAKGQPDTQLFLRHAAWALANGCDGLNVLGTTGEANSLSAAQRRTIMATAAAGLDPLRLMVGTGTPDLETTIALTRHAHELGFAGALILPPFYYKGVPEDGLFEWFARIVEATADAPIPVYLYNYPLMTGIRFSPELARRLASELSGRIVGAKDSSGEAGYADQLAAIEGFDVFPSTEASLSLAARQGYAGCISATVNVAPALSAALWQDQADAGLLARVSAIRAGVAAQPLIPAVKYLAGRIHGDAGFERVLPPMIELTGEQKSALASLDLAA